jgi:hypothetical protein
MVSFWAGFLSQFTQQTCHDVVAHMVFLGKAFKSLPYVAISSERFEVATGSDAQDFLVRRAPRK